MCLVLDTQVELALAYKCEDKLEDKKLVQYIHFNRHVNALRIDAMGNLVFPDKLQLHEISLDRKHTPGAEDGNRRRP